MTLDDYVKDKQRKLEEIYQANEIIYEEEESPDKTSSFARLNKHMESVKVVASNLQEDDDILDVSMPPETPLPYF